jgi:hypothetical protein
MVGAAPCQGIACRKNPKPAAAPGRATALTFFGVKIPLQAVFFEEKIHR